MKLLEKKKASRSGAWINGVFVESTKYGLPFREVLDAERKDPAFAKEYDSLKDLTLEELDALLTSDKGAK